MSMPGLRFQLNELAAAIDQAALAKGAFFEELKEQIILALSEKDKDDKQNKIDDMIAALYMINTRSGKMAEISDPFIRRVQRGARYIRILENAALVDLNPALKAKLQQLRADLTDTPTPAPAEETEEPSGGRFGEQVRLLRQLVREDIAIVVKNIIPDATRFQSPLNISALKAVGGQTTEEGTDLDKILEI